MAENERTAPDLQHSFHEKGARMPAGVWTHSGFRVFVRRWLGAIRGLLRPLASWSCLSDHGGAVVGEAAGFFEEVIVSAGVAGDFPVFDVEHFGGEFSDEVHVVRDEDEGAFVLFEGEDEGFDGDDVEVGGWFVHQQQVGRIDEELDEVEARFFATA